jgi:DNA-binding transcriptional ArsR family regulator
MPTMAARHRARAASGAETTEQAPRGTDLERHPPTPREAKALGHPLRQQILRLLGQQELTNRQLADRLQADPATVLYHVRTLADAGLVRPGEVRRGNRGAREKPYTSTGHSWWISDPLADAPTEVKYGFLTSVLADAQAHPDRIATYATLVLHLSAAELDDLEAKVLAVLDGYVRSDPDRAATDAGRQTLRLIFGAYRPIDEPAEDADPVRPDVVD